MELNDALRIPLEPAAVWAALQDVALVRASMEHCESFRRLGPGEYAITLTVPLGPLRARYEVRAHIANDTAQVPLTPRRVLSFRARADGIGSLRGQIDVALRPEERAATREPGTGKDVDTRIDYSVWATLTGPLSELPARQIENALHELADDFFTEFCAVVAVKHGQAPNRVAGEPPRRQHVFLRPINLAGLARRAHILPQHHAGGTLSGRAASMLNHEPPPHAMPYWAWAAMIFFVALLLYAARWFTAA
ncbi:CoxG family protein [Paraburkholderia silvatlantica]|uniref:Carbon monoxide dehydrogenase subunit G n=1 Tax=Paraburkholderia silvatlantica TaxID=321895 RepID=A0A2U1AF15_9BURK|nr:SRPBCC domain-containing protein [Paraburkholderia silvatlantica]MBB2929702.1 carbon monoxide dehydrogenase subunit G [Paraburkholderia silvatlantica]PVY35000.1 carbon monoxide dehydrogenase subunit G [Paraburkholderia silvatlantica]PXW39410.1 carbon monoxide dehydrogenase subunit G [Paraburkholderia silvatlantica]PYE23273.1 carbon monoxide dehydrogenase subunit G [Paraburkholderia silvatlantica]TDQ78706.1 carbon monoxide dehydrogenase subunit G [Paraburkholderia silvatlantica]